jgi:hypothetical protein
MKPAIAEREGTLTKVELKGEATVEHETGGTWGNWSFLHLGKDGVKAVSSLLGKRVIISIREAE